MPRPKGSKNKPKTAEKTTTISTMDYTELIEEKLNEKTQISADPVIYIQGYFDNYTNE